MEIINKAQDVQIDILNGILESIDEAIHAINTEGVSIYYNKKAANLDGLEQANVLGHHLLDIYPTLTEETSTLLKVLHSEEPIYHQQQQFENLKGKIVQTLNTTLPLYREDKLIGALEISRDLTELEGLFEKVNEMQNNIYQPITINQMKKNQEAHFQFQDIITNDKKMKKIKDMALKASSTYSPVLIYGETGTGKELIAQSIHNASTRKEKAFIAQNCAALPESLLEGILFGTVKGSFTGATDRPGLFELANGGTLFLDEIHSMPKGLQSKLLRVLQEGYVRRVGDTKITPIDVRIITAMNIDPMVAVQKGIIRSDLFYRINVISVAIPPLRDRNKDIPTLINIFIKKYNFLFNKLVIGISKEAKALLKKYEWPGNVRELENAIEGAMNLVDGDKIKVEHLPIHIKDQSLSPTEPFSLPLDKGLKQVVEEVEKKMIIDAMKQEENNIVKAAKRLDIPRQTLQYKIKKYQIQLEA